MSLKHERIAKAIECSGKRKAAIARELNVSQPFISQLCAGQRNPSDRTLSDLAIILGVSYQWLETGEGAMYPNDNDAEMITAWVSRHLASDTDDFKRRFLKVLASLTDDEWALLERKLTEMLKKEEPPADD